MHPELVDVVKVICIVMNRKIWIIGDSFTMIDTGRYGKNSWPELCINNFKGDNCYLTSVASRDIQTIFDIFLKIYIE
jgi:hypothetical protein